MVNSRAKGCRGERDARDALNALGFKTRRGQQFAGGADSPDVVGIPGLFCEVKFREKFDLYGAMDQALRDSSWHFRSELPNSSDTPFVLHRKNRKPWVCVVRLEDMTEFATRWLAALGYDAVPNERRIRDLMAALEKKDGE